MTPDHFISKSSNAAPHFWILTSLRKSGWEQGVTLFIFHTQKGGLLFFQGPRCGAGRGTWNHSNLGSTLQCHPHTPARLGQHRPRRRSSGFVRKRQNATLTTGRADDSGCVVFAGLSRSARSGFRHVYNGPRQIFLSVVSAESLLGSGPSTLHWHVVEGNLRNCLLRSRGPSGQGRASSGGDAAPPLKLFGTETCLIQSGDISDSADGD